MNMDMTIGNATRKEFIDAGTLKEIEAAASLTPAAQEAKGNFRPVQLVGLSTGTMFNTPIADMQENVEVDGYKITGTLKKLTEGELVDAWGEGYFLAVEFKKGLPEDFTKLMVGVLPSYGNGLADATEDPDKNGAWKITDKKTQKFVIQTTVAGETIAQEFDLSGLVLEEPVVDKD